MEWISVKDRIPEETKKVLVWDSWLEEPKTDYVLYFVDPPFLWACTNPDKHSQEKISHWMPLPEPPTETCQDCKNEIVACVCMEKE